MRYDKYKDSGFDWIGEIPEHWKIKKLKYLGEIKSSSIDKKDNYEITTLVVHYNDVVSNSIINVKSKLKYTSCTENQFLAFNIKKGDLIITKDSMDNRNIADISAVDIISEKIVCGYHLYIFRCYEDEVNYKYYFHYLSNKKQKEQFLNLSNGTTIIGLSSQSLVNNFVSVPPFKEQTTIANYLDRKTAEIDQLIKQKEQLLELYEEEKTAIINQAVTKGLPSKDGRPSVSFKDSGIDWLGEIPEHWEVKKLKYLVKLITEKSNGGLKKVGLENIESNSGKFIETNSEFQGEGIRFQIGDILYGKLRPYLSKVLLSDFEGAAVGDFFVLRPNVKYLSDFIKYRLLSSSFTEISNSSTYGSKMPRVSWEFMSHLFFALPIEEEQTTIVQFIETEVSLINSKSEKTKKLIDLLKEYKTALISEVVTGKIKVM